MTRTRHWVLLSAFLTTFVLSGANCPSIPEIKERLVELAISGSTTFEFEARGITNILDDCDQVDFDQDFDVRQLIEDAGIDASAVTDIALAGVAYRVTRPDPNPQRGISSGQITVEYQGTTESLVDNFAEPVVNDVTAFKTATLNPAGVALINQILDDLLNDINGGKRGGGRIVEGCLIDGVSSPTGDDTNFDWELRLTLSIVGEIQVDVIG